MNSLGPILSFSLDKQLCPLLVDIQQKKREALDSTYWVQKVWKGFWTSGEHEGFFKRFTIKCLTGASLAALPVFSGLSLWGVYEIACTLVVTVQKDRSDPDNNFNTVGHIPEWVLAGFMSLYVALKILKRCGNEDAYKTVIKLYRDTLQNSVVDLVQKSRFYEWAINDLKELEEECLFKQPKDVVMNYLTQDVECARE